MKTNDNEVMLCVEELPSLNPAKSYEIYTQNGFFYVYFDNVMLREVSSLVLARKFVKVLLKFELDSIF